MCVCVCVCCVTMRDNFVTPYTQICGVKSDACLPANCSSFLLPTQDVVAFSCALSKDTANAMHQFFMISYTKHEGSSTYSQQPTI